VIERERSLTNTINQKLTTRLKGSILLQVEEKGEAWYVHPLTGLRHYLADGPSAYTLMRDTGLGITNKDLSQIPIGIEERAEKIDSDQDGLDDQLEDGIGTDKNNPDTDGDGFNDGDEITSNHDPLGSGQLTINQSLITRLTGRILLQVESHGEAWYLHQGKRYYMKNGNLAYQIMRFLSLGITNEDLRSIAIVKE
jgi:hypothetical protein